MDIEKQIEIIQEMSEYLVASGENQEIHANNLLEQNNNLIISVINTTIILLQTGLWMPC